MQLRPLVIFVFFFIDGVKVSERLWFCRANFLQPKPKSVGVGNCDLVHLWSEETLPHVCQQGGSLEDFPSPGFSLLDIFQPKQRRGRKYIESKDSLTNGKKTTRYISISVDIWTNAVRPHFVFFLFSSVKHRHLQLRQLANLFSFSLQLSVTRRLKGVP